MATVTLICGSDFGLEPDYVYNGNNAAYELFLLGHTITLTFDGRIGERLIRHNSADVVVTPTMMNSFDWFEIAKELQWNGKNCGTLWIFRSHSNLGGSMPALEWIDEFHAFLSGQVSSWQITDHQIVAAVEQALLRDEERACAARCGFDVRKPVIAAAAYLLANDLRFPAMATSVDLENSVANDPVARASASHHWATTRTNGVTHEVIGFTTNHWLSSRRLKWPSASFNPLSVKTRTYDPETLPKLLIAWDDYVMKDGTRQAGFLVPDPRRVGNYRVITEPLTENQLMDKCERSLTWTERCSA